MKLGKILSIGMAVLGLTVMVAGSVQAQMKQLDKVTADDGVADDGFGVSVSLYGDTALVGAYTAGSQRGAAYVFKWDGITWTQQAKLVADDGVAGDQFGCSVSLDGNTALVGAWYDDSNRGSAYVFKWDGNSWIQQAKLTAADGVANDYFGRWGSVSVSGDYALVGAYFDDDMGTDSGSAYIFKREGTTWTQHAKLTAADGAGWDHFGTSVSLDGDYALVGAEATNDKGTDSGSAYIFKREGTAWTQQAKLIPADGAAWDYSGYQVSLYSDYALVGAAHDDDQGSNSGSAYIFKRDGTAWTQQAKLTAYNGTANDYFSVSVSLYDDCALVGAWGHAGERGSAYLFKREGDIWGLRAELTPDNGLVKDWFGDAVSLSADYALVGAPGTDSKRGAAYIFGKCPDWDVTGDCFVDFQDFAVMAEQWLTGY